jgi:hypothetical protein
MKEMLLFEDAQDVLLKGLKVEAGNRDLKNLQVDITKELNSMKTISRRGSDGVYLPFYLPHTHIDYQY